MSVAAAQCSVVVLWSLSPFLCAALFFVLLASSSLRPLLVLYLLWMLRDWRTPFTGGSDRLAAVRRWNGWLYWKNYFGVQLVKVADLPSDRNYIMAYHPHGLYCFGAFCNFVTQTTGCQALFPDIHLRLTTLRFNFFCPFWREINLIYRFISVDYQSCKQWLMSPRKPKSNSLEYVAENVLSTDVHDRRDSGIDTGFHGMSKQNVESNFTNEFNSFEKTKLQKKRSQSVNTKCDVSSNISISTDQSLRHCVPSRLTLSSHPLLSITKDVESPLPIRYRHGEGKALLICVGGADESLLARPGKIELVLNRRKGFVRLALDCGASLVPVITFGEVDIYRQVPNPPGSFIRHLQSVFQRIFGWTIPLSYGRFGMWLPFRRPLVTVVGEPLDIPWIPDPSYTEVAHWHQMYINKLTDLYNTYKDIYDPDRDCDMEIVA